MLAPEPVRAQALAIIDSEREALVNLQSQIVRIPSPNPPGDTRDLVAFLAAYLQERGIEHRVVDPQPEWPNLIATVRGRGQGKRLVLNDHLDHFPAEDPALWIFPPYAGEVHDGNIYGRGVSDNKNGICGMLYEVSLLDRLRDHWNGELVATFVSDEETFGPYGARYLLENCPEVIGDAVLSAECSGGDTVLFGEKGLIWLELEVTGPGGHAAFTHTTPNAIQVTAQIITEAEREIHGYRVEMNPELRAAVEAGPERFGAELAAGAEGPLFFATLNVGVVRGGLKVNMIAGSCRTEVDMRVPLGATTDELLAKWDGIVQKHPGASWKLVYRTEPNACAYDDEFFQTLARNVGEVRGVTPTVDYILGMTDLRLWRARGIPAAVYGPEAHGMGAPNEHITVRDLVDQVKAHTLTALDFLGG
jgi:succinyl-diaminopimelate desuccinylase